MEYPRAARRSCLSGVVETHQLLEGRGQPDVDTEDALRARQLDRRDAHDREWTTPLMVIARPSTDGSPPNSESHTALLITATAPVSTVSKPRPWAGLDPIVSK